ncbi:MAG: hypothetical protein QJT81_00020 [Candidatus Thiothrix putei]|uniref:CopG family transcriptional regulator n=1 Tax=Candidatus Thiothrix putei TaxID=3080811 RepID=A0AA95KJG4_9GAMM|nr:MAG: hypothetical protein QJT81_00020 [Candidatus Thiothrix putei]
MPQLHCYVPDEMALQLQRKAEQARLSVSKYLAQLIQRDVEAQWPQGYFELFGSWEGEPLQRPEQGTYEVREVLF